MKININTAVKRDIDLGDVIICEKGQYLIVGNNDSTWPIAAVDLTTFKMVNAYSSLPTLQSAPQIFSKSGSIIDVIKSKNLEIRTLNVTSAIGFTTKEEK